MFLSLINFARVNFPHVLLMLLVLLIDDKDDYEDSKEDQGTD